jgi:hypothetical protein
MRTKTPAHSIRRPSLSWDYTSPPDCATPLRKLLRSPTMKPVLVFSLTILLGLFALVDPARASVLTFEIFDPALSDASLGGDFPFEDSGVQPFLAGYGYPEGFGIPGDYGDRITASSETLVGGTIYQYGLDQGATPNVVVSYGPFSIFTGGPQLWREGYGDLNGILFQASEGPIGNDYDILDIVLVADPGFDVVLHSADLGGFGDYIIDSVTVFDGVPFPFLTPMNQIFGPQSMVSAPAVGHNTIDFGDLQSHVIWLRIDANNLGDESDNIGIDNIVFSQMENVDSVEEVDLGAIEAALQQGEVPEAASLLVWLIGGACAGAVLLARRFEF